MPRAVQVLKTLCLPMILIGFLVACSSSATPVAIATFTLVPPTITPTALPTQPSSTPSPTNTTQPPTITPTAPAIAVIAPSSVTPQADTVTNIRADLAERLSVDTDGIDIAQVEAFAWFDDDLRCGEAAQFSEAVEDSRTLNELVTITGVRYRLLVGSDIYDYHVASDGTIYECQDAQSLTGELLLAVDPLAVDILFLVQRTLAEELDLSTRRIQLVDIAAYTWEDASLGCPQDDQTYTETNIPGYRIVVTAGTEQYIYHSDFSTAFPCDAASEVLPE